MPLLRRQRLLDRLDHGLDYRLTQLQAPAGCGKSVLLGQWRYHLEQRRMCVAWVRILRPEIDRSNLLPSLACALHIAGVPGMDMVDPLGRLCTAPYLLDALISGIGAMGEPVALLIDDLHLVREAGALRLIEMLLDAAPRNLHVCVATRAPLLLGATQLVSAGHVHTVSTDELLFSSEEADAFLRDDIPADEVAERARQAAGWPLAAQLVRLGRSRVGAGERRACGSKAEGERLLVQLVDQIRKALPRRLFAFLLDTSILSTVTAELANAVRGQVDAAPLIGRLCGYAPIFAAHCDCPGTYRIQPLLAEALRLYLEQQRPERFAALQRAAAGALSRAGRPGEAIRHARSTDDPGFPTTLLAARSLVADHVLRGTGELRASMAALEDREWERHPHVWQARILLQCLDGQMLEAECEYRRLRLVYAAGSVEYVVNMIVLQLVLSRADPDRLRLILCESAPELARWGIRRTSAPIAIHAAVSLIQSGEMAQAEDVVREALDRNRPSDAPLLHLHGRLHIGWIMALRGDLAAARSLLDDVAGDAQRDETGDSSGIGSLARAYLLAIDYESGGMPLPATTLNLFLDEIDRGSACHDGFVTGYRIAIESAYRARGADAALLLTKRGVAAARALALGAAAERMLCALQASILARSGRALPSRWPGVDGDEGDTAFPSWDALDAARFAAGVAALADGRPADASVVAQTWLDRAEREGRQLAVCRAALMAAVALWRLDERAPAPAMLERAFSIAIGRQILAPFLEHGEDVRRDIGAMLERTDATSRKAAMDFLAGPAAVRIASADRLHSLYPLSKREVEVLERLRERESNKIIGRRLNISHHAVKFHTKNIFRKLGVHSREDAVRAVEEMVGGSSAGGAAPLDTAR